MIIQYNIQCDKENGHANDRHHHHPHPHTRAQQLMMEMVLVRQERVLVLTKAAQHHTYHVQQRYQDRGKGNHLIRIRTLRRGTIRYT